MVVSSGDGGTGDPLGYPSTKYPKGESTVRAVASNQLIIDFGVEGIIDDETADDAPTWLLLQRIEADAIYAEVSLPRDSSGGKINGWSERILLQPIPRPDASVLAQIPQEPEPAYDVAVARR